jgi:signal transduction histidine kinase
VVVGAARASVTAARGSGRVDAALERLASVARSSRWRLAAWITAVVLLTVGAVLFGRAHGNASSWAALPLDVLATAPLLLVPWWPLPALSVVTTANAVFVIWGRETWPPAAVLSWLIALAVAPLLLRRMFAVALLIVAEVAVIAGAVMPVSINPRPWDAPITEALAVLLVWGVGETVRWRRETRTQRAQAADELRRARERTAVALGRAEIARELHDVVAHHVSLIAVRAAMTPYQVENVSPGAVQAFEEIAGRARVALDELRAVLGVLRDPDTAAQHAPQPGLADLPDLFDGMRANGMRITARLDGGPRLPEPVELCCYRVVQEALTNAARHAPGEPVEVMLHRRDDDVVVRIANHALASTTPATPGFGLIGMRERVTALGGGLRITTADTTFRVTATIPARPA